MDQFSNHLENSNNSNNNREEYYPSSLSSKDIQELKAFKSTLPDPNTMLKKLHTLQFYALCPNGKRIPVNTICEEYSKDPNGLAFRTFQDRLVLVIQAVFQEEEYNGSLSVLLNKTETVYWQQAFYLSTGTSSDMKDTWLPFDGIYIEGNLSRTIGYGKGRERIGKEKTLRGDLWFSKSAFENPEGWSSQHPTFDEYKSEALYDRYGSLYLPEGKWL